MKSQQLTISGILESKLSRLYVRPQQLYYRGDIEIEKLLRRPCVGVVGTRLPTAYGKAVTEKLVEELVRHNIVIISGMALGTDGLAHQSALKHGGQTIAVLPSSVTHPYPRSHVSLADKICQSGLLVSEYISDDLPRKDQFIARNRIIAALSDVLLIPEAAEKSGSLHTANFALEMGIPVMAVPGNITSRMSGGTNRLISQGAKPVLSAEDVLSELKIDLKKSKDYVPESEAEARLLEVLTTGLQDGAKLQQASRLDPQAYMQTLTMLEIKGIVAPLGADQWHLK